MVTDKASTIAEAYGNQIKWKLAVWTLSRTINISHAVNSLGY